MEQFSELLDKTLTEFAYVYSYLIHKAFMPHILRVWKKKHLGCLN